MLLGGIMWNTIAREGCAKGLVQDKLSELLDNARSKFFRPHGSPSRLSAAFFLLIYEMFSPESKVRFVILRYTSV